MRHPYLRPPAGAFSEFATVVFQSIGALLIGLILYTYLISVEAHLVSDRFAREPATFAPLALDDATIATIRARSRAFESARRAGEPLTLTLSNNNINEWFAVTTDIPTYRDRVRLRMHSGSLIVTVSLPLEDQGFPGRYLNAEMTLQPRYEEESLEIMLEAIHIGGTALPPRLMGVAKAAAIGLRFFLKRIPIRRLEQASRLWVLDSQFHIAVNQ